MQWAIRTLGSILVAMSKGGGDSLDKRCSTFSQVEQMFERRSANSQRNTCPQRRPKEYYTACNDWFCDLHRQKMQGSLPVLKFFRYLVRVWSSVSSSQRHWEPDYRQYLGTWICANLCTCNFTASNTACALSVSLHHHHLHTSLDNSVRLL